MSEMYEEPEDPGHEPNRDPIKIAVETEITFGEVLDRIAWRALDSFRRDYAGGDGGQRNLDHVIERRIAKAVDAKAKALVEERVEAAVSKLLAAELEEAKKRFRASVDALIEAKVLEAARAALLGSR